MTVCVLDKNYSYVYQIAFFSLLSLVVVAVAIVTILASIGFFSDPRGYCKITEGDVEVCKQIKRKGCEKEQGEFFFQSKDCKPKVLF